MRVKFIFVVFLVMSLIAGMAAVAEQNKGAKDMELNGGSKGKVPFPHHVHQAVLGDCNACHDIFPQTAGAIDNLKAKGDLKSKQVMNTKCVKCHKAKEAEGVKTGPTSCSKCHQKS